MATRPIYGVTPPLSDNLPTEEEKRRSDSLVEELRRQKTFESPSATEKRYKVLESLQRICDEFVKTVARIKDAKNEIFIRNAHGKVFTYGSFRLGVFGPGSDIDTLIVAPKYVTRDDYFEHFPKLLIEMAPKSSITDLAVVTDAFVPIIKFEYSGISIDLIFSRIIQKQLSPEFNSLKDSNLLRGLDDAELRSLNGTRVTDEILQLVPEQSTFKMALRAIKLWAQRRAIYGNIMGFPGGVAWAMLVARVCQLYPRATTSVIVNKFFLVMEKWQWPQPVLLKPIENGPLPVRVWNPKVYKGDSFHLMPIITPAYPSMCATFNITRSSMTIINRELKRGLQISEDIMTGKRPWADLFVKHTFFTTNYRHYIVVTSASKTRDAYNIWSGYIESKVRMLVQRLEQHPAIALAHIFNKGYERRHICRTDLEVEMVQEGSLDFVAKDGETISNGITAAGKQNGVKAQPAGEENGAAAEPDQVVSTSGQKPDTNGNIHGADDIKAEPSAEIDDDQQSKPAPDAPMEIFTMSHYIGLDLVEGKKMSLDLSYQVEDFKSLCQTWPKYKEELEPLVSIGVQHVRNFNLPDDLFEANEKKPQKKVAGVKNAPGGTKRGPSEDETPPAKRQQASVAAAG